MICIHYAFVESLCIIYIYVYIAWCFTWFCWVVSVSIGCLPYLPGSTTNCPLRVASRSETLTEDENCRLRFSTQKYVTDILPSSTHCPQTLRKQWYPVANGRIAESLSQTNSVGAKWIWVVMNIYTIFSCIHYHYILSFECIWLFEKRNARVGQKKI